jgi:hypothetical protein
MQPTKTKQLLYKEIKNMRTQTLIKLILVAGLMVGCGSSADIIPPTDDDANVGTTDSGLEDTNSNPETGTIDSNNNTDGNDQADCDNHSDSNINDDVVTVKDTAPPTDTKPPMDSNPPVDSNPGSDSHAEPDSHTEPDACQPQDCNAQKCVCEAFCNDNSQCEEKDRAACLCECQTAFDKCQADNTACSASCGK